MRDLLIAISGGDDQYAPIPQCGRRLADAIEIGLVTRIADPGASARHKCEQTLEPARVLVLTVLGREVVAGIQSRDRAVERAAAEKLSAGVSARAARLEIEQL